MFKVLRKTFTLRKRFFPSAQFELYPFILTKRMNFTVSDLSSVMISLHFSPCDFCFLMQMPVLLTPELKPKRTSIPRVNIQF